MNYERDFEAAVEYINSHECPPLSNETKLCLYGLYKCSLDGSSFPKAKPAFYDTIGRAKFDAWVGAWSNTGDSAKAKLQYIDLSKTLGFACGSSHRSESPSAEELLARNDIESDNMPSDRSHTFSSLQEDNANNWQESGHDTQTSTQLHNIVLNGNATELRDFLSHHSVDINQIDLHGLTALHLAADRGYANAVKVLLDFSADKSIVDFDSMTALDLAIYNRHQACIDYLQT